jgi:predicted ATPase
MLNDEATVKVFKQRDGKTWLLPRNSAYEPIDGDYAKVLGEGCGSYSECSIGPNHCAQGVKSNALDIVNSVATFIGRVTGVSHSTPSIGANSVQLQLLTFQNFQGFKGNQHAKLAPITLIFGPNASGKSSIGRALRVFKQTVGLPDQLFDVDQIWDGPSIKMRNKNKIVFRQLNEGDAPAIMGLGYTFAIDATSDWPGVASISAFFSENVVQPGQYLASLSLNLDSGVLAHLENPIKRIVFGLGSDGSFTYVQPTGGEDHALGQLLEIGINAGAKWSHPMLGAPTNWVGDWVDLLASQNPKIFDNQIHWGEFNKPDSYLDLAIDLPEGERTAFSYMGSIASMFGEKSKNWFSQHTHIDAIRKPPEELDFEAMSEAEFTAGGVEVLEQKSREFNVLLNKLTDGRFQVTEEHTYYPEDELLMTQTHVTDAFTSTTLTFHEVGTGIGQVYPILDQLIYGTGSLFVEEPEIHLHPKMQADLMDAFIDAAKTTPTRQFLIETHSESMLLRLQRRIREGKINVQDVSVLYVDAVTNDSNERFNAITEFQMDDVGDLIDPFPDSFAGLRIQDLL